MPRIPYRNLAQSNEMEEKLEMSTAEIGLSVRTTNCLEERGIFTVHDLLKCTRADLLSISNFGEKTLEEVYKDILTMSEPFEKVRGKGVLRMIKCIKNSREPSLTLGSPGPKRPAKPMALCSASTSFWIFFHSTPKGGLESM